MRHGGHAPRRPPPRSPPPHPRRRTRGTGASARLLCTTRQAHQCPCGSDPTHRAAPASGRCWRPMTPRTWPHQSQKRAQRTTATSAPWSSTLLRSTWQHRAPPPPAQREPPPDAPTAPAAPWLQQWRLRTALADPKALLALFCDLSVTAARCFAAAGRVRTAAALRCDAADVLAREGRHAAAALLYEQLLHVARGWRMLAAHTLPRLLRCQQVATHGR